MGDRPRLVQPPHRARRHLLGPWLEPADVLGCLLQQPAQVVGEVPQRATSVGGGDLRGEQEVRRDAHRGADESLGDPLPAGGLRAERADSEHEHGADRDLDQVRAQPQRLADHDGYGDQDAEAPPCERYDGGEHHRQRHPRDDADDPVQAAGQQADRRHLDDEQRGEWREQGLGAGEERQRDDVARHRRDGQSERPRHRRRSATAEPAYLVRRMAGKRLAHARAHATHSPMVAEPADPTGASPTGLPAARSGSTVGPDTTPRHRPPSVRGAWSGTGSALHRDVRDTVVEELRSGGGIAEPGVPVDEVGLRVQARGPIAEQRKRLLHQHARETLSPVGPCHDHPADACVRAVVEDPQVRHRGAVALDPQMTGSGLEVPAVELRVGALLFDHEHRLPQLPQQVRRTAVEVVERRRAYVGPGHRPSVMMTSCDEPKKGWTYRIRPTLTTCMWWSWTTRSEWWSWSPATSRSAVRPRPGATTGLRPWTPLAGSTSTRWCST